MDLYSDVERKIKLKRKILFSHESACLKELITKVESQNPQVIVMWAFDCAQSIITRIENRYPAETRPGNALVQSKLWAEGKIKMSTAKKAIIEVHRIAKEINDNSTAALYHSVGQACSTVHTRKHAMGLVFYELTSVVIDSDYNNYENLIEEKIEWYSSRLEYWKRESLVETYMWADFLKS